MANLEPTSAEAPQLARELIAAAAGAESAAEVGRRFFAALQPYGARALWARAFRSAHPDDAYDYSRISPPRWEQLYSESRFAEANFVTRHVRRAAAPYRWLSVMRGDQRELELAHVLADLGFPDGIAAPLRDNRYLGMTSLAFERLEQLSGEERRAIAIAATALHQRMRELTPAELVRAPALSPRERDCLALVAEGMTDWEIGETLGIAETTVLTHVQSARRKLGARSRAQAVALCILSGVF